MKILYIVPYVPSRIRIRPFNFIQHLGKNGHEVTLLTLWTDQTERAELNYLESICKNVVSIYLPKWRSGINMIGATFSGDPLQSAYCWHPGLARLLRDLLVCENGQQFDVVHIEHLRGARYGAFIKSIDPRRRIPIVWDSVDCISLLFRNAEKHSSRWLTQMMARFDLTRTEKYEGRLSTNFDRVICTSSADRQALLSLAEKNGPPAPIDVIPNGVDLDYFQPQPGTPRDPATLVISGKMSYHANIAMVKDFVLNVLPRIWEERPDVKLIVVGKSPPREILQLADSPRIVVTGTVEDNRPYLCRATIAVAPLTYGVGIQNKVLEAMACSTPVVCSSQAASALKAKDGEEIIVAEGAENLAKTLVTLLDNPIALKNLASAGRRYVENRHRWEEMTNLLEQVYTEAVACKKA
jgi:polysaccharide biosynthesis protein PslH